MMTRADPGAIKPIIALLCTRGMEDFLANSLHGILQVGIDPGAIHIGCPNNALELVTSVTSRHSSQIHVISDPRLSENEGEMQEYSCFGSRSFTDISWKKVGFIRKLIETHPHVVYADLDISWIRNPLPYLSQVASAYPMAFQTEGLPQFPPALCCGFASFVRSERTSAFLEALIEFDLTHRDDGRRLDDQVVCQRLIEGDASWLQDIYCLPEALFLNGLGYRNLQNPVLPSPMRGELLPFLFHANWTVGADNKRNLLAQAGLWFDDGSRKATTDPGDSSHQGVSGTKLPGAANAPLLSVVYPVFDLRGEATERLRLWAAQQDIEPNRYRIFVVAGSETDLDESRLRKVLRAQDVILRVPGIGREADYWNEGAHAATTPWIVFVEGHCMPRPGGLSALARWIDANPNGQAGNFAVENLDHHRTAKLMKRWFAEVQDVWAAPSTWPRLHRAAFAIRRDVFEAVGPFKPEYGQFAPPLLSARMHDRGLSISTMPGTVVIHDDSLKISAHHDDTADYARGEMDARADSDPAFFEKYFGPSPLQDQQRALPAQYARTMLKGLLVTALNRPWHPLALVRQGTTLLPAAILGLRHRARLLAALTRLDEWVIMHPAVPEGLRWRRFLLAHRRVVRTEQMLWLARHPSSPLQPETGNGRWPIDQIDQQAIIGLHALEHLGSEAFRWTRPVCLLRLALPRSDASIVLETRNVRGPLALSDCIVVIEDRIAASEDCTADESGNIKIQIRYRPTQAAEIDIVVIVPELLEPVTEAGHRRRLGLPLFSVQVTAA